MYISIALVRDIVYILTTILATQARMPFGETHQAIGTYVSRQGGAERTDRSKWGYM